MADRSRWAEEHPWIAGGYFGFILSAVLTVWWALVTHGHGRFGLAVGLVTWLAAWLLFAILAKRRVGLRPNHESYPVPTRRRPWTRSSDRVLLWFMLIGIVSGLSWLGDLLRGPNVLGAVAGVVVAGWFLVTTWTERRSRRKSE